MKLKICDNTEVAGAWTQYDLEELHPISFGRQPGNTVVFQSAEKDVSRYHAEIFLDDAGDVCFKDLSTKGSTVDGKRVHKSVVELQSGSRFRIDTHEFEVRFKQPEHKGNRLVAQESDRKSATDKLWGGHSAETLDILYSETVMRLKKKLHAELVKRMKLPAEGLASIGEGIIAQNLGGLLDELILENRHLIPHKLPEPVFRQAMLDEFIAYGPITGLLNDHDVEEVMVNGSQRVFAASSGRIVNTAIRFLDDAHVVQIIKRIVERLGLHVDDSSPMVDARLPDGSRVNAVLGSVALNGSTLTIRKFPETRLTIDDLVGYGTLTKDMADFLSEAVRSRQNIIVSGGTGSGKTTLLNVLSDFIPDGERIITVEDSAELRLNHSNLVRLEARPPNIEGKGQITIQQLVANTLRMRPDRIVVGECRRGEAFDMLQAMNTGHDGSLTTVHSNGARDALTRIENMVLMAVNLETKVIRKQISSAVQLVVHQERFSDGSRRIVEIEEVTGTMEGDTVSSQTIFEFERTGFDADGKITGRFKRKGITPRFIEVLREAGDLQIDHRIFAHE